MEHAPNDGESERLVRKAEHREVLQDRHGSLCSLLNRKASARQWPKNSHNGMFGDHDARGRRHLPSFQGSPPFGGDLKSVVAGDQPPGSDHVARRI